MTWVIRSFFESQSHFRSFALMRRAICLKKFIVFTMFLSVFHCFPYFYAQEQIAPINLYSVTLFKEWQERFALKKSESLFCTFAHKNEQNAWKTKEQIPNPGYFRSFSSAWTLRYSWSFKMARIGWENMSVIVYGM